MCQDVDLRHLRCRLGDGKLACGKGAAQVSPKVAEFTERYKRVLASGNAHPEEVIALLEEALCIRREVHAGRKQYV